MNLLTVLIAIVVALVIFLVFREVVTWYWKINRIVTLLTSVEANLGTLAAGTHPADCPECARRATLDAQSADDIKSL